MGFGGGFMGAVVAGALSDCWVAGATACPQAAGFSRELHGKLSKRRPAKNAERFIGTSPTFRPSAAVTAFKPTKRLSAGVSAASKPALGSARVPNYTTAPPRKPRVFFEGLFVKVAGAGNSRSLVGFIVTNRTLPSQAAPRFRDVWRGCTVLLGPPRRRDRLWRVRSDAKIGRKEVYTLGRRKA